MSQENLTSKYNFNINDSVKYTGKIEMYQNCYAKILQTNQGKSVIIEIYPFNHHLLCFNSEVEKVESI